MTVNEAKVVIAKAVEDLQQQGIWIHNIRIDWRTDIPPEDVKAPVGKTKCSLVLEAQLHG